MIANKTLAAVVIGGIALFVLSISGVGQTAQDIIEEVCNKPASSDGQLLGTDAQMTEGWQLKSSVNGLEASPLSARVWQIIGNLINVGLSVLAAYLSGKGKTLIAVADIINNLRGRQPLTEDEEKSKEELQELLDNEIMKDKPDSMKIAKLLNGLTGKEVFNIPEKPNAQTQQATQ